MVDVKLLPTDELYIESFQKAVDAVARERKFIGFVEGPPLEQSAAFVRHILAGNGAQFLAVSGDIVVGWCDIVRNQHEGFRHVGRLGMALLPHYRGLGFGRLLANHTLESARQLGIERVTLDVLASNVRAIALYRKLGFVQEGTKRRARKLDGRYEDEVFMALIFDEIAANV
jgi:ribosomal protein S18 acetylase RimI-like enzyme